MKIDWFTTVVRHFANVASASDQPTYIGPMLVCCLGLADKRVRTDTQTHRQTHADDHKTLRPTARR